MQKVKNIKYLDFPEEVRVHKKEYLSAIQRVLESGSYVLSHEVENFETDLAKYLGTKYCVGTANGLEAIQIALMAYEVGKGDEVITTPISAVATTLAILAVGATPVFADVDGRGQIDAGQIEKLVTKNTKAIIPVDLYGQPCDLIKIREICKKYKLYFIEDACQAHGASLRNKKLGTYGDVGCFSFYPTKNLGAFGDGGALVTNDEKLAKIFRELRDYGQQTKYVHTRYGLNSRLDELHAALLSVKLKYLDKNDDKRRKIAERYIEKLKNIDGLELVLPDNLEDSNFHLFVIKTSKRDALQDFLKSQGIPSLIHYPITIPDQPMFGKKYKKMKITTARKLVSEVLSIPCHPYMSNNDVDYVSGKIIEFFRK
jgi:dTDP-4-amino-4,6-dideoxygalactose transaminase